MTANSETNPITMATNIKLTTQKLQTLFEQSVPLWKEQPGGSIQPVPTLQVIGMVGYQQI